MQQQEKGAPPQFMSTHPSVGLVTFDWFIQLLMFDQSYNREEAIRGW